MKNFIAILLLAVLIYGLSPNVDAHAQENNIALRIEHVDITSYPNITIRLSAWDVSGLPLANLTPENFTLREDGSASIRPQTVRVDTETALSVGLVLDISGSMAGDPLSDAKVAAARFLDRLKTGDRAALIAFSDPVDTNPDNLNPQRELAFTSDLAPMYDLVESLTAQGQTQLYNAETKAVQMAAAQPVGHRAILLLSDGRNEPADIGDSEQAIRLAQENNIPFFVIGLGDQIDESHLRRLASETGGFYRSAPRSSELAKLFSEMAVLLKTQYVLTYKSNLPADGADHNLVIALDTPHGQAEKQIEFGPLPFAALPTATLLPAVPTVAPATEPAEEVPEPQPDAGLLSTFGWGLAAIIALSLGALVFWFRRRRPVSAPEICAQCGFDLTGKPGACSQCGSARRLPKRK